MVAKDLYGHLGCKRGASLETVKKYAKLTKAQLHTDKHPGASKEVVEKLLRSWHCMEKTLEILSNEQKRKAYNQLLREGRLGKHGGVNTNFEEINRLINDLL